MICKLVVRKSQKDATARWDKAHMTTISCRATRERAERFKAACQKLETVPNAVLLKAINDTIEKAEGQEQS